eukprot:COSAG02_NODE_28268_length_592_cov_1.985801_1_plen_43_part_01
MFLSESTLVLSGFPRSEGRKKPVVGTQAEKIENHEKIPIGIAF